MDLLLIRVHIEAHKDGRFDEDPWPAELPVALFPDPPRQSKPGDGKIRGSEWRKVRREGNGVHARAPFKTFRNPEQTV